MPKLRDGAGGVVNMSIDEFNETGWGFHMKAVYHGSVHLVASCDFEEKLVGLVGIVGNAPEKIVMVRCENVRLLPRTAIEGTQK